MSGDCSRREVLSRAGALLGAGIAAKIPLRAGEGPPAPEGSPGKPPPGAFRLSFNTATIRSQKIGIAKEIDLVSKAGFDGLELWIDELDAYEKAGGSLEDLGKRARDSGLELPNAIWFFEWMVDDGERRKKALEDIRRRMGQLSKVGCRRIAAPPAGDVKGVDLLRAAERYRELLEIGEGLGVTPVLEIWGSSPAISRIGQAALVVMEAAHRSACMVPDVFHLHKGGSDFDGIRYLSGEAIGIFHLNDYPAQPPRAELKDSHRIYPGDGIAPLGKILRDLRSIGYKGMLSLELFNPELYKRDPAEVVREGLEKSRAAIRSSAG